MGSSISGNYTNTLGKSQPYANSYLVASDMFEMDKKDSDIYDSKTGYFKNPSATNLNEAIRGDNIYLDGNRANGTVTYVMDMDGNIIFGKRVNPVNPSKRAPHPTLIGGKNPKVQCAGMITFSKGKIVSIDNRSGHFKPNIQSMAKVEKAMDELYKKNPNVFSRKSKWRK